MHPILAIRSFFSILFKGALSDDLAAALGLSRRAVAKPAPTTAPATPSDGALQILAILQRDSRLIDFLMEDITAYSDDQVGAAVRSLHDQCRDALNRYVQLAPVIDGVEGTFTRSPRSIRRASSSSATCRPSPRPAGFSAIKDGAA